MATHLQQRAPQVVLVVKNLPANAGNARDAGLIPGSADLFAWEIPWKFHGQKSLGLKESTGSQRAKDD